ncbi:AraC family transcriptional regulator [Paraburkholderia sp. GV068]|jgi:AraC-like DNA-binding protein|uniref:AraC family transcriptional regulator n=1 Tax=Paraburkholderia TaxID=1822464 RepID=UPI000D2F83CF|nr:MULTISPECIES: AraC family transcriptional regulator [unclassified Paraburkholderia]PTQ92124.1 AraC family transcriptional regulator [Paraburkholderia sp. GV072]PUA94334.1 AraC family transcriptional regulator [Paraburkholderia sp. GV068]
MAAASIRLHHRATIVFFKPMPTTTQAHLGGHARTVSNRIAVFAMAAAERAGVPPELFTARTGIGTRELADTNGRIDGARHRRVVELMTQLGPSARGAFERPQTLFPDFPVLGNLCLNARTLREALESFCTFRALIGEFDFLYFRETSDYARFDYIAEFAPGDGFQALANFQVIASLVRVYEEPHRTPLYVSLVCPTLPGPQDPSDFFGTQVRYDVAASRLEFPAALLDVPFGRCNSALAPFLREQAQRELLRVKRGHLFSNTVEQLIGEIITDAGDERYSSPSLLARICERLETSRWTLHRQLQTEGLHFTELEARVKFKEACRLLRETHLSVAQISEQLGFSSQSAFTRFFRTRHDAPPSAFRLSERR